MGLVSPPGLEMQPDFWVEAEWILPVVSACVEKTPGTRVLQCETTHASFNWQEHEANRHTGIWEVRAAKREAS